MFNQNEHEALMRLMTNATGYVSDSRHIAHWLQAWENTVDLQKISHGAKPFIPSCG